jgi:hypothetical protein
MRRRELLITWRRKLNFWLEDDITFLRTVHDNSVTADSSQNTAYTYANGGSRAVCYSSELFELLARKRYKLIYTYFNKEPWWSSRYSDWLRAGQRDRSSSTGRVKNFHFIHSRTVLGSIQPPIQWVPGPFSLGLKPQGREADNSTPTSAENLYIHFSIRLHSIALN